MFQTFLGKEGSESAFSCKPRGAKQVDMVTVERFPADRIDSNGDCGKSCKPPAISFCFSEDVYLHGVLVFGKHGVSGSARTDISVCLSSVSTGLTELRETKTIFSDGQQQRYQMMFDSSVIVRKDCYYTVRLKLDDQARFYYGQDGKASVTANGVTVLFCSTEVGGCTDVKRGQIAGIIFSR